jgi:pyruvate formate-lyase/glycerol dehydratase family glycyl radical enzyme
MEYVIDSHTDIPICVEKFLQANTVYYGPRWQVESFKESENEPVTIRRAKALNAVLDNCGLPVLAGELLLGCGPYSNRTADQYDEQQQKADAEYLAEIGCRDFGSHSDHHAPDYASLLTLGFGGLKARVRESLKNHDDPERIVFLESVAIALDGASRHMLRWSERLRELAEDCSKYAGLLQQQSNMMRRLAEEPPKSFWEAVQLVYSYNCMMQLDLRYAMAYGRMDQYLYPFYQADISDGRLNDDRALDILVHFFAKVTSVSGEVQNIAIGGVKPLDGSDATNDLSYLILEACKRVGRPGGNITARIHRNTPPEFLEKCAEVIRTGIGYPAVFNDDVQIPALVNLGFPLEDARDYCFVGCIEVFIPGKMAPWTDGRFNTLRCVNLALYNGFDTIAGKHTGLETGDPATWEEFYSAFLAHMRHQLRLYIEAENAYTEWFESRASEFTSPLMSALISDCICRGRDLNDHGAIYPANHGIAGMGIGVVSDSLAAIKKYVYEEGRFTLNDLRRILSADFTGYEEERHLLLRKSPKYGNDNDAVDSIAAQVTRDFGMELLNYRNSQGGFYWGLMGANISNIYAGLEVGATADGRLALQPLSDAASPTFGRDTSGLTSVIRSIAKLPYHLCPGGNVINIKLHPSAVEGEAGKKALAALVRTCFDLGGIQLQFNTVDREVLVDAMNHPADYRGLVVRVSGFSAHYVGLDRAVQEDILQRTEHTRV